jgi:CRISPR-associated protein Cas1
LADDLMEPFRPIVDFEVREMVTTGVVEVEPAAKRRLAGLLWRDEASAAGTSPLSTCILRAAQSLAESYLHGEPGLVFPVFALDGGGDDGAGAPQRLSGHVAGGDVRPAGADEGAA